MTHKTRLLIPALLMLVATAACAGPKDALPAPVKALESQGVQIVGQFDTGTELAGYAGVIGLKPVAIYVTTDGQHAIIGQMINGDAELIHAGVIKKLAIMPASRHIWSQLEKSTWVPDGHTDAPRIVYVFSDTDCPYCHLFWQKARPWVKAGKVQLRHVMVGVISDSSPNKAAAVLTAANPEQAYTYNQRLFSNGGITPLDAVPDAIAAQLNANQALMRALGIPGTPGIVYRNDDDKLEVVRGVPSDQALSALLGPR